LIDLSRFFPPVADGYQCSVNRANNYRLFRPEFLQLYSGELFGDPENTEKYLLANDLYSGFFPSEEGYGTAFKENTERARNYLLGEHIDKFIPLFVQFCRVSPSFPLCSLPSFPYRSLPLASTPFSIRSFLFFVPGFQQPFTQHAALFST
jgi:hypothetical protein